LRGEFDLRRRHLADGRNPEDEADRKLFKRLGLQAI
jgi:hypothetical protein